MKNTIKKERTNAGFTPQKRKESPSAAASPRFPLTQHRTTPLLHNEFSCFQRHLFPFTLGKEWKEKPLSALISTNSFFFLPPPFLHFLSVAARSTTVTGIFVPKKQSALTWRKPPPSQQCSFGSSATLEVFSPLQKLTGLCS